MSGEMSETIFVVNQIGSGCYGFPSEPQIDKYGNWCGYGWFRLSESYMPPPGECWEYRLTRKGDIDTDGAPIGWKIVGIGNDGSVLCQKGNGQRRRYLFGDWVKEQPSGEAWERLVAAAGAYTKEYGNQRMRVSEEARELMDAYAAYEAAQSAEPNEKQKQRFIEACQDDLAKLETAVEVLTKERDEALRELANERSISDQVIDERNATIAELRSELDETRTERHAYKSRLREFCQRLVDMVGAEGPEDAQVMLDKVNAELHRLKQNIDSMSANLADKEGFLNSAGDEIERLTKERYEALAELRSLSTISGQTIAELRARLAKPEMPEVVRELVDAVCLEFPGFFAKKIAAVEAHYAPPFRIQGPGVYSAKLDKDKELVIRLFHHRQDGWLGYFDCTGAVWLFDDSGRAGDVQLTKLLRPLEG